jgi:predicted DNA-binding protein with PD1-like motif
MESKVCKPKKLIVARLDAGEDLLLSLQKLAEERDVKGGWFSVIGGVKRLAYGLFENGTYHNIVREAKRCCFELLPTAGNISVKEGKTFAHCHIIASDEEEGKAFGGHLIEGSIVYPVAEVYMQECDVVIKRIFDSNTKFWPLKFD